LANTIVDVIIPAYNEEASVVKVLQAIPKTVRNVVVVNNNSTDNTAEFAKKENAIVLNESFQGYGAACLCGIKHVNSLTTPPEIIVFIDADYSDYPEELNLLIQPIIDGKAQMVIGSRALGNKEKGAMLPQQIFGNWLAVNLIRLIYKHTYTDLGPFRAIKTSSLNQLKMQDKTYGWTVEMQVKALKKKFKVLEIPVSYRKRIGVSKITGTIKGTVLAGYKIITTIFKYL
jgi:glycosyltransferase involved in cell wall biosynthesis